jgi:hypothetical protein
VDDRVETEDGHNDEGEVIIRRHDHPIPRLTGILGRTALGVVRAVTGTAHLRRNEQKRADRIGTGAHGQVQIGLVVFGQVFVVGQAHERATGFVFDRGDARRIYLIVAAGACAGGAVPVQVGAVCGSILAGRGVTYSHAGNVFHGQPGI